MSSLPIIESCVDCGACCMLTPVPPFQDGESIARDVPDELMKLINDRVAADQHLDPLPCVWFDSSLRQCRHYNLRPEACRKFETGSDLCRLSRWDMQIPD